MIYRVTQQARRAKVVTATVAVLGLILAAVLAPTGAMAGVGRRAPALASKPRATLLGASRSFKSEGFQIRPELLPLSADGTAFVGGSGWKASGRRILDFGAVHWTSFGGAKATGSGLLWLNDCTPNCAQGTFHHDPATVTASAVRRDHYARLAVTSIAGGHRATDVYSLYEAGSDSSWNLDT
jgi:hypothetical protein